MNQREEEHTILQRRYTIVVLKDVINQIKKVAKGTNIAKIIGNSSSFFGTGGILVGLFFAPFTAGMSLLMFYIPGGALSFLGSVTAVGASIANTLKEGEFLELAKCALQKDKDALKTHEEIIKDFMTENGYAKQIKQWVSNLKNVPSNATVGAQCYKKLFGSGPLALANTTELEGTAAMCYAVDNSPLVVNISRDLISTTGIQGLRSLVGTDKVLAMSTSTLKITLPLAIASMTLDIYSIIQTSIDMKTGNTSLACGKLKQMCELLEDELQIMEKYKQFH